MYTVPLMGFNFTFLVGPEAQAPFFKLNVSWTAVRRIAVLGDEVKSEPLAQDEQGVPVYRLHKLRFVRFHPPLDRLGMLECARIKLRLQAIMESSLPDDSMPPVFGTVAVLAAEL